MRKIDKILGLGFLVTLLALSCRKIDLPAPVAQELMTEESEYQAFFQKALDKAGKSINDMNDDEKKAFFNY